MKHFLCILIIIAIMLPLLGCGSTNIDPVYFFYCRNPEEFQYFESDGVIVSESRDLTGHNGDLQYLIALYLAGPLDEGLISPFPRKTRLLGAEKNGSHISIELTDLGSSMSDSEFSLAAACLAQTCMHFTDSTNVTIKSGIRNITIHSDNIILFDTATPETVDGG